MRYDHIQEKRDIMVKRNYNILTSQDEWIYAAAASRRVSQSAVMREIIAAAMAAEDKEARAMTVANLIQAAEAGRTFRQVLESAYGKPAEEIGVELADINASSEQPKSASSGVITEERRNQLFVLAYRNNVPENAVKAYLQSEFGLTSSKDLTVEQFNTMKAWLERGGDLPDAEDGNPVGETTFGDQVGPLPLN